MKNHTKIKAVDLFCGAGGLTHGLQRSGISVTAGYDIEESCRYAYEINNNARFIKQDVTHLSGNDVAKYLAGGDYTPLLDVHLANPSQHIPEQI